MAIVFEVNNDVRWRITDQMIQTLATCLTAGMGIGTSEMGSSL